MNIIKGLIIKDLLQIKVYKKTFIVCLILFILFSSQQENITSILLMMMVLLFSMFSIASFNYDEMAKSDKYILTFPVSRKEVVLSKYILIIGSTIIGSIIGIILTIIISFITTKQFINIRELISLATSSIFGIGIVEAIQIPYIFKYGAEKGRIYMIISVFVVASLCGGIFYIGSKLNFNFEVEKFIPIILILFTFLFYYISYIISCKIYNKKEL